MESAAAKTNRAWRPASVELWRDVFVGPTAPWTGARAQVFTYVLVGEVGGAEYLGTNQRLLTARQALAALLREVKAMPSSQGVDPKTLFQANLFCIPAVRGIREKKTPLETFNFKLAGMYRQHISNLIADRPDLAVKLSNPGPFLVAFRKPVSEVVRPRPNETLTAVVGNEILFIDMTDSPSEVIPVYISVFNDTVREGGLSTDTALTALRARFVAAVVKLNKAVPFVAEAYAGMSKAIPVTPGSAGAAKKAQP